MKLKILRAAAITLLLTGCETANSNEFDDDVIYYNNTSKTDIMGVYIGQDIPSVIERYREICPNCKMTANDYASFTSYILYLSGTNRMLWVKAAGDHGVVCNVFLSDSDANALMAKADRSFGTRSASGTSDPQVSLSYNFNLSNSGTLTIDGSKSCDKDMDL